MNYAELPPLVEQARKGDERALVALFAPLEESALRTAWRALGNREDAEDAVQMARVQVWLGLEKLRDPITFPAYFRQVVWNQSRYLCRLRGRQLPWEMETLTDAEEVPSAQPGPLKLALQTETVREVQAAILRLPEADRTALKFWLEETAVRIMAERQRISIIAAKKRTYQAKRRLARILPPHLGGAL